VNLFVFPDAYFGQLPLHLVALDKRVWDGRMGELLEFDPVWFKEFAVTHQRLRIFETEVGARRQHFGAQ
jgi:GrpB-like predicted nucleotidyltransferase (UPF0157 family)